MFKLIGFSEERTLLVYFDELFLLRAPINPVYALNLLYGKTSQH